jgi:hypothetical protein
MKSLWVSMGRYMLLLKMISEFSQGMMQAICSIIRLRTGYREVKGIYQQYGSYIPRGIKQYSGLLDNTVYGLFADSRGQLWAALDNGISLIQYNLPFCFYNEQNGLNGNILCLYYCQNDLYAGTSQYLFAQNELGNFEIVQGSEGQIFDLVEARGILLAAQNPGILSVKGRKADMIADTEDLPFLVITTLPDDPDHLIAGSAEGLYLLKYFNTLIRKVSSRDSLLFEGDIPASSESETISGPDIHFKLNDLVFSFAAAMDHC